MLESLQIAKCNLKLLHLLKISKESLRKIFWLLGQALRTKKK
ncbi:hypothetical protein LEP1GSC107_0453 [Leptospira interrogans serovar Grippotyphosa str. UI 12769]|nr:hypothetical protein LEP1GSC080_0924 [Leptospira interrogans str. FPW2026]EKR45756.1 hypothetical protein LEP1GSC097_2107 [Leptospira interrogans serovar Grippotyphosa str. UI 08368]EMN72963.1 hypothetical protein LEP1GSC100_2563 [Leptospira interrogans serovar Bataviae str. UI 08561]EMN81951.1 hypothetical protein LEP1GSC106_1816 [Leptospira interrogans serovar Grippotyphosa str. UI 12764]EMN87731.1 hypothetical protein LEP1GSC107_0453 [Leptospira interrogans serovar Grippotyphosa str. UI 1